MTDTVCVRCERPMADQAYACVTCAYRAGDQLHEIADMTPAARDIARNLARNGSRGASGKPGSRLPFDTMATQKLNQIQARLSTWVDKIAHARTRPIPAPRHLGDDPIALWARWLAGHVEWIRRTDDAERFLAEVGECVSVMRGVARGPGAKRYLGPCGATIAWDGDGTEIEREAPCDGDVYAWDGANEGACRSCRARWATAKRQAWLDGEVRDHAYRASEIEDAYGVSANRIRVWAARGKIPVHGTDRLKRALYLLSTVLDYAAATVLQAELERAKRERRAAVRETEDAA